MLNYYNNHNYYIMLNNPKSEKIRGRYLAKHAGITIEIYEAVYESQKGICKLCNTLHDGKKPMAVFVDKNKKPRCLICNRCKMALSFFNEDIALLKRAAQFIEFYSLPIDTNHKSSSTINQQSNNTA